MSDGLEAKTFALAKDGFYTNVIIADRCFVETLVESGRIDFATELTIDGPQPSPGDPVPLFYEPSDPSNWNDLPSDLRDAADKLAHKPSFAVDKGDVNDQPISGTEWVRVIANRRLWDADMYDLDNSRIIVKSTGTYDHDVQLRLNALVNVASVEVSLFMEVQGEPDDYWFTLSKQYVLDGMTEVHLGNSTQFDFYAGEVYNMAIQLTPVDPEQECSATILGSDDFTAWGASWSAPLVGGYRD